MMTKMFKKSLVLICSVVVLLALFLSGCGKKGPPRPPVKETVDQHIKGDGSVKVKS
jgi:predicted small lipoprotein YifL